MLIKCNFNGNLFEKIALLQHDHKSGPLRGEKTQHHQLCLCLKLSLSGKVHSSINIWSIDFCKINYVSVCDPKTNLISLIRFWWGSDAKSVHKYTNMWNNYICMDFPYPPRYFHGMNGPTILRCNNGLKMWQFNGKKKHISPALSFSLKKKMNAIGILRYGYMKWSETKQKSFGRLMLLHISVDVSGEHSRSL